MILAVPTFAEFTIATEVTAACVTITLPEAQGERTFETRMLVVARIWLFVSVKVSLEPDARVVLDDVICPDILLIVTAEDETVPDAVEIPYRRLLENVMPVVAVKVIVVVVDNAIAPVALMVTEPPLVRTIVVDVTVMRSTPPPS